LSNFEITAPLVQGDSHLVFLRAHGSLPSARRILTAVLPKRRGHGTSSESIPSYEAIIIGAGWAGLKAADTLLSSGITSILVLEANDYIGGRSKTNNDFIPDSGNGEVPIDLGSEWLYTGVKGMVPCQEFCSMI
jgi:hypothetical protein